MPECPICGSPQLVPVQHGRHRTAASLALAGTQVDEWVCGDCGRRFDAEQLQATEATLIPFPGRAPEPGLDPGEGPSGVPPTEATPQEPPASIGATLRRAREQRGISIEEAAEATGIWPRDLRALEEDGPAEAFPGLAYARLYLRDYAAFLGLDPEPLLARHRALHGSSEEEPLLEPLPDPREQIRRAWRILTTISATILLVLMVAPQVRLGGEGSTPPSPTPLGASAAQAADLGAPVAREPRRVPPRVDHLRIVLELREPCWIGATVDGERTVSRTAAPRERIVLRADRVVELVLGNGGGVILRANGERVPTGDHGEVVRLTFRLHDGVVRTERA